MRSRTPRKATILDGMILVAAAACGLALSRAIDSPYYVSSNWFGRIADGVVRVSAVLPFLMTFTPAVLIMRLRRPRPGWRRLARQPGVAACAAAMMPVVFAWLEAAYLEWDPRHESVFAATLPWGPGLVFCECGYHAGVWVLAAWLALALSGRRRSERSGIDRLGRLVGVGWLMMLAVRILGTS
jgi:hypothetical protein